MQEWPPSSTKELRLPRIALYTATTGQYEDPFEILSPAHSTSSQVDYYRFSDRPVADTDAPSVESLKVWRQVHDAPRVPGDSIRNSRAIKILGHPSLSACDVTVWIDNRVRLKVGADELVERFLPDDADIALPMHSFHGSLSEEFNAVLRDRQDDPRRVREQRSTYMQLMPHLSTLPVYWTAILIRRNNDNVRRFNQIWWEQVLRFSRRDQLSFLYAEQMTPGLVVSPFVVDNSESDFHEWRNVSGVGRAPGAGRWRPASLKVEVADTVRCVRDELTVRGKEVVREKAPAPVFRGLQRLRDRARGSRA